MKLRRWGRVGMGRAEEGGVAWCFNSGVYARRRVVRMRMQSCISAALVAGVCGTALAQPAVFEDLGTLVSPTQFTVSHNFTAGQIKWYRFTIPAVSNPSLYLDFNTFNTSFTGTDAEHAVYSNTGARIREDDDDGVQRYPSLSFGRTTPQRVYPGGTPGNGRDGSLAAGTYWLAVAGYNASFGTTGWNVTTTNTATGVLRTDINFNQSPIVSPPPANDACTSAQVVTDGGTYTFETTFATEDGTASCESGASSVTPDIWYLFTPPSDGALTATTCGSAFDTVLSFHSTCGASFACASNDGLCGLQETLTSCVTAGTPVLIRVAGILSGSGTGTLGIEFSPESAPYTAPGASTAESETCGAVEIDTVNGGCSSETPVFGAITCGETVLGTTAYDSDTGFFDTDWYQFTLASPGTAEITGQTQFLGLVELYWLPDSTCDSSVSVGQFSTVPPCANSFNLSVALSAGTYGISVSNSSSSVGDPCGDGNDEYWLNLNLAGGCTVGCPCTADFDGSGGTPDAGDIDAFFAAWLSGDASADADCSGGTPDAGDIDTFFAQWLAGGC
jgi:hypothetical protein